VVTSVQLSDASANPELKVQFTLALTASRLIEDPVAPLESFAAILLSLIFESPMSSVVLYDILTPWVMLESLPL
jgi:hypothetical protein